MNKKFLLASLLAMAQPLTAAVDMVKVKQAEKIALSLTGQPLSSGLRAKVIAGQITLEALAEQLSASPEFIQHFVEFWTKLLGMQSPLDVYAIKTSKGNDFNSILARTNWLGLGTSEEARSDVAYLSKYIASHESGPVEVGVKECPDAPVLVWAPAEGMIPLLTRAAVDGMGADTQNPKPILPGTQALWQRLLDLAKEGSASCDDPTLVTVKPYWDPVRVTTNARYANVAAYKVTPKVLERYGPAMIDCNLRNASAYDKFLDQVGLDISMEPGYIIGHVVAEDRPFSDVVTSPSTVMTGT